VQRTMVETCQLPTTAFTTEFMFIPDRLTLADGQSVRGIRGDEIFRVKSSSSRNPRADHTSSDSKVTPESPVWRSPKSP